MIKNKKKNKVPKSSTTEKFVQNKDFQNKEVSMQQL